MAITTNATFDELGGTLVRREPGLSAKAETRFWETKEVRRWSKKEEFLVT
jgi:hypothetical protein